MESTMLQSIQKELSNCEQVECPVEHNFSEGIYTRTIHMPAGALIVGKQHKTQHLNVILQGHCEVMIGGEIQDIKAPYTFESLAGSQKLLYIFEDTIWMTIHVNEDNETNDAILEDRYIMKESTHGVVHDRDNDGINSDVNKRRKQSSGRCTGSSSR